MFKSIISASYILLVLLFFTAETDAASTASIAQPNGPSIERLWSSAPIFANGIFVLIVTDYNYDTWAPISTIYVSPDGGSWTKGLSFDGDLSVWAGEGRFLALGSSYDMDTGAQSNTVFVSADGLSWTKSSLMVSDYVSNILSGNGTLIIITTGYNPDTWIPVNTIYTSKDGETWTKSSTIEGLISSYGYSIAMLSPEIDVSVSSLNSEKVKQSRPSDIKRYNGQERGYDRPFKQFDGRHSSGIRQKNAMLDISPIDPEKAVMVVNLSGEAAPPKIFVNTTSLEFDAIRTGNESPLQAVLIENRGESDLLIDYIKIAGSGTSQFSQTNNCTTVLAESSCTVSVIFTPKTKGVKTTGLKIVSNDPKKPTITVELQGRGL